MGRFAIEASGAALKRSAGGRGLLIGGVPGMPPARIVLIGGGVVGTHAARLSADVGAAVTILDRSIPSIRELDEVFERRVRTRVSTIDSAEEEVLRRTLSLVRSRSRRGCAETCQPRHGELDSQRLCDRGSCHRSARSFRDIPGENACRSNLRGGWRIHCCIANMRGAVPLLQARRLTTRRGLLVWLSPIKDLQLCSKTSICAQA